MTIKNMMPQIGVLIKYIAHIAYMVTKKDHIIVVLLSPSASFLNTMKDSMAIVPANSVIPSIKEKVIDCMKDCTAVTEMICNMGGMINVIDDGFIFFSLTYQNLHQALAVFAIP